MTKLCDHKGCTDIAMFRPVFVVYAGDHHGPHAPARGTLGLYICLTHRRTTKIDDLMNDEGFNQIKAAFHAAGFAAPARDRILLEWEEL